jgi:hypothetical protein
VISTSIGQRAGVKRVAVAIAGVDVFGIVCLILLVVVGGPSGC